MIDYVPARDNGMGRASGSYRSDVDKELENLGVRPGSQDAERLILGLLRAEWDRRQAENQAHRVSVATGGKA